MVVKGPGPELDLTTTDARSCWARSTARDALPPYVRLIHDVLIGDRSLFTRPDGLAHAWEAIDPVLTHRPGVQPYPRGSWGPAAADPLAAPDGWLLDTEPRVSPTSPRRAGRGPGTPGRGG